MLDGPIVLLAIGPLAYRAHELQLFPILIATPLGFGWLACVGAISLLYALHAFIWNQPARFTALCSRLPLRLLGSHPVDVFAALEILGKLWQAGCLVTLLGADGTVSAARTAAASPAWLWATLVAYVAVGQGLNAAM